MKPTFNFTIGHLTKLAKQLKARINWYDEQDSEGLADEIFRLNDISNLNRQLSEVNDAILHLNKLMITDR